MDDDVARTDEKVVRRAWRAFGSGDPDLVREVLTPDAEWLAPPGNPTAVAIGGEHHLIGRDRIARFLTEEFPEVFVADVAVEVHGVHAAGAGGTVVLEETMRATLAHGGHYENDYCFVFEVDGGRVARVREYMDTRRGAEYFAEPHPPPAPATAAGTGS